MSPSHLNLSTLAWLDQRRFWASTDRGPSLGFGKIRTLPTLLVGQSTRPGVVYRAFAPSYWLAFSSALFGLSLGLVVTFLVLLALGLARRGLEEALLRIDAALSPEAKGCIQPHVGLENLQVSTRQLSFPCLLYSLVGSLDAIEGFDLTPGLILAKGQTKPR